MMAISSTVRSPVSVSAHGLVFESTILSTLGELPSSFSFGCNRAAMNQPVKCYHNIQERCNNCHLEYAQNPPVESCGQKNIAAEAGESFLNDSVKKVFKVVKRGRLRKRPQARRANPEGMRRRGHVGTPCRKVSPNPKGSERVPGTSRNKPPCESRGRMKRNAASGLLRSRLSCAAATVRMARRVGY